MTEIKKMGVVEGGRPTLTSGGWKSSAHHSQIIESNSVFEGPLKHVREPVGSPINRLSEQLIHFRYRAICVPAVSTSQ